jgi:hypothetical protein
METRVSVLDMAALASRASSGLHGSVYVRCYAPLVSFSPRVGRTTTGCCGDRQQRLGIHGGRRPVPVRGADACRSSSDVLVGSDRVDTIVWDLSDWGESGYWHLPRRVDRHGMYHVGAQLLVAPSSDSANSDSRRGGDARTSHRHQMRMTASNHSREPMPGDRLGFRRIPVARHGSVPRWATVSTRTP